MIAIPRKPSHEDALTEFVCRRLGGRALVVSEYASRLVEAVDELTGLVVRHSNQEHPWSPEQLDRVIKLDGRIEALRIRLGIDAIREERVKPFHALTYSTDTIGYTGIEVRYSYPEGGGQRQTSATPTHSWDLRMKSLRAIAQELAIAPELDPEEEEIVKLVMRVGRRLTTTQILDEFSAMGVIKAESTIKGKLAQLTKRKILVNRSDTSPKGYGLPEWA